jgi:hypothetical protein
MAQKPRRATGTKRESSVIFPERETLRRIE